jgi:hypothetical protein
MHIYLEISQGNSLCFISNKQRCYFFSSTKVREQGSRTGPVGGVGVVPVGGGERG